MFWRGEEPMFNPDRLNETAEWQAYKGRPAAKPAEPPKPAPAPKPAALPASGEPKPTEPKPAEPAKKSS